MLTAGWSIHYRRGLGSLARHNPQAAVKSLQRALEGCPASRRQDLYHVCFYLGVALQRAGYSQSAIKSWTTCQRLNKRGPTRKMLSRYTNCYGMERQESSVEDDWNAFYAIQAARYLNCKNKRTFSTAAEQDMIGDLIKDSWRDLEGSGRLTGRSGCEKMGLFRGVRIVFPTVLTGEPPINGPVISVNFQTRQKVGLEDRCTCGSGMAFYQCCGRTPGKEELISGVF
jgi:hypothetical protein